MEAAGFVDACNHPKVGWYFDVGNVLRYGRPVDWIEALGHRILKIDVKEYSLDKMNTEGPWKGFEVEIGDGDCDWPAVNRALADVGYSGWASVEFPAATATGWRRSRNGRPDIDVDLAALILLAAAQSHPSPLHRLMKLGVISSKSSGGIIP